MPEPSTRFRDIVGRLVTENGVTGPLMTDAMLAALAIDHGVTLSSTDTDVERLDGLRHINPLGQQGLFDRGFGQRSRGLRQTFL